MLLRNDTLSSLRKGDILQILVFVVLSVIISLLAYSFNALLVPIMAIFVGVFVFLYKFYPTYILYFFLVFSIFQDFFVVIGSRISSNALLIDKIDEPVILLLLILTLFRNGVKKSFHNISQIEIICLLFFIVGLLSSIKNNVSMVISLEQSFLTLKGLILFYIYKCHEYDADELIHVSKRIFAPISIVILIGAMIEFISPLRFKSIVWQSSVMSERLGMIGLQSFFYHPGDYGWFMIVVTLIYAIVFMFFREKKYFIIGIMFLIGSLLSLRRKPLLGFIFGILISYILFTTHNNRRISIKKIAAFGLIGGFVLFVVSPFLDALLQYTIAEYFTDKAVLQARNALLLGSVKIAIDYFPLGVGFGRYGSWMSWVNYSPVYNDYGLSNIWGLSLQHPNFIADTFWPMILGETGILGLILFSIIMLLIIRQLIIAFKSNISIRTQMFTLIGLTILLEGLVESIAQPQFVKPPSAYITFAILGIVISLSNSEKQNYRKTSAQ
mgnify:CR=1 FL=1|jgi:hypothetical protein